MSYGGLIWGMVILDATPLLKKIIEDLEKIKKKLGIEEKGK